MTINSKQVLQSFEGAVQVIEPRTAHLRYFPHRAILVFQLGQVLREVQMLRCVMRDLQLLPEIFVLAAVVGQPILDVVLDVRYLLDLLLREGRLDVFQQLLDIMRDQTQFKTILLHQEGRQLAFDFLLVADHVVFCFDAE